MKKPRVIILGAGISGLSCAYFLAKQKGCDITVLEKSKRAGGWLGTLSAQGFLFEQGPRTFLFSKCKHIRQLARELGLEKELVLSSQEGKKRYLWIDGKLRQVPIWSGALVKALLKEWRVPALQEDESIWDFACRRFNPQVARHFFDPMVTGIYAGNIHELSMQACFPTVKKWEQEHGSITKGLWKMQKQSGPSLFTFENGVQSFVDGLERNTDAQFHYGEEALAIELSKNCVKVTTQTGVFEGEYLISSLPAHVAGKLLDPELLQIAHTGATVVNLGYHRAVLDRKGFGYIVSSQEQAEVLGVIFDTQAFPRKNKEETKLTVMLKESNLNESEALTLSLAALKKHLNITVYPDIYQIINAPKAFPQMKVGHVARMQALEARLSQKWPNLKLLGNYLYGVGVEDCIARAKSVSESFLRTVDN